MGVTRSDSRWLKYTLIVVITVLLMGSSFAAGIGVCLYLAPANRYPGGDIPQEYQDRFAIFWEAWDIIEREFYHPQKEPDPQEMIYGAVGGMIASMGDRHTTFVEPAQTSIWEEDLQGSFEGIGANVSMVDGRLVITCPLAGSPAEKAGLQANDVVLEVDGVKIENLDLLEAISLIRGPKGTIVHLKISREGQSEPFEVAIKREKIDLPTVESEMLDGGIGYLRLTEFNARATSLMRDTLKQLLDQEARGMVLDLRSNPGGYLQTAVEIGSQFIDEGIILIERGKNGVEREYRARKGGVATQIPLVVLVDGRTASASEIVAGAIQDHGRGVLVGQPTYGKGSVQESHHLSDGSSLRVTTARWYTPNDREIDEQGLTPDIVVEFTPEDVAEGRDPQLDRAREYLLTQ